MSVQAARARLAKAQARLERAQRAEELARAASDRHTPGGLTNYDPALLSGIRRKANRRADERRWAAYDREARLVAEHAEAKREHAAATQALLRAEHNQITRATVTPERLASATHVRDKFGWHKVTRVNKLTVTVESRYALDPQRIAHDKVLEVRP